MKKNECKKVIATLLKSQTLKNSAYKAIDSYKPNSLSTFKITIKNKKGVTLLYTSL